MVKKQITEVYEKSVDTKGLFYIAYERPAMMEQLPVSLKDKWVLDARCAAGWYTEQLINQGANVAAIDIRPKVVAAAKTQNGRSVRNNFS